jgi:hypothetical protein
MESGGCETQRALSRVPLMVSLSNDEREPSAYVRSTAAHPELVSFASAFGGEK